MNSRIVNVSTVPSKGVGVIVNPIGSETRVNVDTVSLTTINHQLEENAERITALENSFEDIADKAEQISKLNLITYEEDWHD